MKERRMRMHLGKARNIGGAAGAIRLRAAIHQHKALSVKGLQERLFSQLFTGLVYPQIWEDPEVDLAALQIDANSRILTIASGGCNVMSYLSAGPARIHALDLNAAHVALGRLKLAAAASLPDQESFYRFFGDAADRRNIAAYDTYIRPHLDEASRAWWDRRDLMGRRRIQMFARNFYHHGLLGRFIGAAHLLARAFGVRLQDLAEAPTQADQVAFFERRILPVFESRFVQWLTTKPASLFGLGIPPAQFHALAGGRPMHEVLRERVRRLACDFPMANNYFARQAFGRAYGPDGALPPYLESASFEALRNRTDRVEVLNRSVTEFMQGCGAASLDRYVLLDAQDWMTDAQLTDLWTEITRTAAPGARVIFRTAAEPSLLPGRLPDSLLDRWHYHAEESLAHGRADRSSIYGGFHLYSLKAGA
jgi:S-adenosylmethionine-diacylglycerol 3-amino-3-carboxypropyl transferase